MRFSLLELSRIFADFAPFRSTKQKALARLLSQHSALASSLKVASWQKRAFAQIANTVEVVCLGSSHAHKGFYATEQDRSFNFANSSVDLRLSVRLYEYIESIWPFKRANIIVFYDVFSDGFQTERCSDAHKCIPYELLYGIHTDYPNDELYRLTEKLIKLRKVLDVEPPSSYRGNNDYGWFFPPESDLRARVDGHLKHAARGGNQTRWLSELTNLASRKGRRVWIVIPPYRRDYTALVGAFPYAELHAWLSDGNGTLLDFSQDSDFLDSDFGDADHLNMIGAQKLTQKIMKEVV